jgi:hypothetical protein
MKEKKTCLFQDALGAAASGSDADCDSGTFIFEKSFSYKWPPSVDSFCTYLDIFFSQG